MKAVAFSVVALLAGTAAASRRDWIGSAACGACHPKQLAAWQRTPHALTRIRALQQQPASGSCLACHGTGEAPLGPTIAVEVGCEACHGAGKSYAEDDVMRDPPVAIALGMTDVSTPQARAALCATCHMRRTLSHPFDPASPVHDLGDPRESMTKGRSLTGDASAP